MTQKEINTLLSYGRSHIICAPPMPLGITRFQIFLSIKEILKGKQYWATLRNAYESTDNLYRYRFDVHDVFLSDEPQKEFLMDKAERDYLKKLPEKITIYRGLTVEELKTKKFGISWTLDKKTAEFYAYTYGRNYDTNHLKKTVHKMEIDKVDVMAFLNERNEQEVIYLHDKRTYLETLKGYAAFIKKKLSNNLALPI